jgi:hypothetical protein
LTKAGRRRHVPDVRDIVELSDNVVEDLRADEAVLDQDLGGKVAECDDGRLVGPNEDRSDEKLVVGHPLGVAGRVSGTRVR